MFAAAHDLSSVDLDYLCSRANLFGMSTSRDGLLEAFWALRLSLTRCVVS